ncbi:hypothetical protein FE407_06895 [Leuconostoc carnosum]|uniref:hypothetical protein n=1 Tax=Leuconostoc TaxID=1243 RepID=UPI000D5125F8|nr:MULTISPECIES: hypothetical protein [Leuconostoc]KAA8324816.1 hypothetical protein FE404_06415 [Leuconostoc carnosum]KAA8358753.1 hypothetical protein FE407_06895 [Leuconostoc carnosum]KAA8364923.1 hypothetical protein FE406_06895 [Leuconostoc carnosum]KAA8366465.1 hypothetical protein FE416_07140 [Leuconostoc carnosum]KAA8371848.1 hypothetical protein FE415_07155 [Leuconostoc carnosum]
MGLFKMFGNHIKQQTIQNLADSSGLMRDLIRINQIKKRENAQNKFGVRLEYVPETSEEDLVSVSSELFDMTKDQVLGYVASTPVVYVKGLDNHTAKEVVKYLKGIGVQSSVS